MMTPEIADALFAASYDWTKHGSIRMLTSLSTDHAMAMVAAVFVENKRDLAVIVPCGGPLEVETTPPSAAGAAITNN